jgi:hypothetical protein
MHHVGWAVCPTSWVRSDRLDAHAHLEVTEMSRLSDREIIDAYVYMIARYIVIRQEHIDLAEDGVGYNTIKFDELGRAEFVYYWQHGTDGERYMPAGTFGKVPLNVVHSIRTDDIHGAKLVVFRVHTPGALERELVDIVA